MATQILKNISRNHPITKTHISLVLNRTKTTSSEYVSTRARDPTFEKLMDRYKNLLKVISVQDLILSNPITSSVSLDFLNRLSQKLHLNRGATSFLRRYPHIFHISCSPTSNNNPPQPYCTLTDAALSIARDEAAAIKRTLPDVVNRLVRILSMSVTREVPLRAVFKGWREIGLPDDFEDSVIAKNPIVFELHDGNEPGTHVLRLVGDAPSSGGLVASVEDWRVKECCKEDCGVDRTEIRFSFKHGFPPGMRLGKVFKARVKEWQRLPCVGPYEKMGEKKGSKYAVKCLEKRAVGIVHEFLSLTVEKTVEVEKISHFRKWFGIDFNIRDLFLDHPGMFYLSTKGKRHTVFLREAYERGCLIEPNPVYEARRKLLDLVAMERRGFFTNNSRSKNISRSEADSLRGEEIAES